MNNNFPVLPDDRYGGDKRCFYCKQDVGAQHAMGCVMRRRTVIVRITMNVPYEVPEDWDSDAIEFHLNESSWCSDNIIEDIQERHKKNGACFCDLTEIEYIGEGDMIKV